MGEAYAAAASTSAAAAANNNNVRSQHVAGIRNVVALVDSADMLSASGQEQTAEVNKRIAATFPLKTKHCGFPPKGAANDWQPYEAAALVRLRQRLISSDECPKASWKTVGATELVVSHTKFPFRAVNVAPNRGACFPTGRRSRTILNDKVDTQLAAHISSQDACQGCSSHYSVLKLREHIPGLMEDKLVANKAECLSMFSSVAEERSKQSKVGIKVSKSTTEQCQDATYELAGAEFSSSVAEIGYKRSSNIKELSAKSPTGDWKHVSKQSKVEFTALELADHITSEENHVFQKSNDKIAASNLNDQNLSRGMAEFQRIRTGFPIKLTANEKSKAQRRQLKFPINSLPLISLATNKSNAAKLESPAFECCSTHPLTDFQHSSTVYDRFPILRYPPLTGGGDASFPLHRSHSVDSKIISIHTTPQTQFKRNIDDEGDDVDDDVNEKISIDVASISTPTPIPTAYPTTPTSILPRTMTQSEKNSHSQCDYYAHDDDDDNDKDVWKIQVQCEQVQQENSKPTQNARDQAESNNSRVQQQTRQQQQRAHEEEQEAGAIFHDALAPTTTNSKNTEPAAEQQQQQCSKDESHVSADIVSGETVDSPHSLRYGRNINDDERRIIITTTTTTPTMGENVEQVAERNTEEALANTTSTLTSNNTMVNATANDNGDDYDYDDDCDQLLEQQARLRSECSDVRDTSSQEVLIAVSVLCESCLLDEKASSSPAEQEEEEDDDEAAVTSALAAKQRRNYAERDICESHAEAEAHNLGLTDGTDPVAQTNINITSIRTDTTETTTTTTATTTGATNKCVGVANESPTNVARQETHSSDSVEESERVEMTVTKAVGRSSKAEQQKKSASLSVLNNREKLDNRDRSANEMKYDMKSVKKGASSGALRTPAKLEPTAVVVPPPTTRVPRSAATQAISSYTPANVAARSVKATDLPPAPVVNTPRRPSTVGDLLSVPPHEVSRSVSVDTLNTVLPARTLLRRQRRMRSQGSEDQTEDPIERLNRLRARISGALSEVKGVLKQYSSDAADGEDPVKTEPLVSIKRTVQAAEELPVRKTLPMPEIEKQSARKTSPMPEIEKQSARKTSPMPEIEKQSARKTSPMPEIEKQSARKTSPMPEIEKQPSEGPVNFRFVRIVRRRSIFDEEEEDKEKKLEDTGNEAVPEIKVEQKPVETVGVLQEGDKQIEIVREHKTEEQTKREKCTGEQTESGKAREIATTTEFKQENRAETSGEEGIKNIGKVISNEGKVVEPLSFGKIPENNEFQTANDFLKRVEAAVQPRALRVLRKQSQISEESKAETLTEATEAEVSRQPTQAEKAADVSQLPPNITITLDTVKEDEHIGKQLAPTAAELQKHNKSAKKRLTTKTTGDGVRRASIAAVEESQIEPPLKLATALSIKSQRRPSDSEAIVKKKVTTVKTTSDVDGSSAAMALPKVKTIIKVKRPSVKSNVRDALVATNANNSYKDAATAATTLPTPPLIDDASLAKPKAAAAAATTIAATPPPQTPPPQTPPPPPPPPTTIREATKDSRTAMKLDNQSAGAAAALASPLRASEQKSQADATQLAELVGETIVVRATDKLDTCANSGFEKIPDKRIKDGEVPVSAEKDEQSANRPESVTISQVPNKAVDKLSAGAVEAKEPINQKIIPTDSVNKQVQASQQVVVADKSGGISTTLPTEKSVNELNNAEAAISVEATKASNVPILVDSATDTAASVTSVDQRKTAATTTTTAMPELQVMPVPVKTEQLDDDQEVPAPFKVPKDDFAKKKVILKKMVRKSSTEKSANKKTNDEKTQTTATKVVKAEKAIADIQPDEVGPIAEAESKDVPAAIVPPKKTRKVKKKVIIKRQQRKLSVSDTFFNEPKQEENSPDVETLEKTIEYVTDEEKEEELPEPPKPLRSCIKQREFEIGEWVLYGERYKKTQVRWKKGRVIERITSISYKIEIDGKEVSSHISYLKKHTDRKVNFGGKEYLEIDYEQIAQEEERARNYSIWNMV